MYKNIPHNRVVIKERQEKLWILLTRGMKGYEIAKELNVDPSTISRDIQYLISQSQNYLDNLAKETLPFMYETSIEGIRNILKECWNIYLSSNNNNNSKSINVFHQIAALKLAKECNEALFKLTSEGPTILVVKSLEERLNKIEIAGQISQ
jgi:IS30 family transposase